MADYPSLADCVTQRRLGNALKTLRNLSLELEDVIAHLTLERKIDKMTATTGQEAGRNRNAPDLDCASALSEPSYLSEEYDG